MFSGLICRFGHNYIVLTTKLQFNEKANVKVTTHTASCERS